MPGTYNANVFFQKPAEEVDFTFDNDSNLVKNVDEALEELFDMIQFAGSGYEGMEVATNGVIAGVAATEARVLPGAFITDQGSRRRAALAAALDADYTNALDQQGDGTGTGVAFVAPAGAPPAAGEWVALHGIVDDQDNVTLAYTNLAAIPEDSVPDLAGAEIGSKILAILPLRFDGAADPEFVPSFTYNSGPDKRWTSLHTPDGGFDLQASTEQAIPANAVLTAPITLNGVPISDIPRKVEVAFRSTGPDVGDDCSVGSWLGGVGVATSRRDVAAQDGPLLQAVVITDVTGQIIQQFRNDANSAGELLLNGYETYMGH